MNNHSNHENGEISRKEELYRSIVDDSVTGTLIAERSTRRIIFCNKRMRVFCHIAPDEAVVDQLLYDVLPESEPFLTGSELSSLTDDSYVEYHKLYNSYYLSVRARALIWSGTDAYIVYASDETSEYEKHMRQQDLLNLVPLGIGVYEIDHGMLRQLYMNDSYFRMVGETRESRRSRYDGDFIHYVHPDDRAKVRSAVENCINGSQKETIDHRIQLNNGLYHWFKLTASVISRAQGTIKLYCAYADIDDNIQAHSALRRANTALSKRYNSELELRQALENDSSVVIQFDVTSNRLLLYHALDPVFDRFKRGMQGETIRSDLDNKIPTEKERAIAADFLDPVKALERFRNGVREFHAEYRSRQNDGRLYWAHAVCRLAQDKESGDIISYTFIRNIDTSKKRELVTESVIDEEMDFVMLLNTVSSAVMLLRLRAGFSEFALYKEFPFDTVAQSEEMDHIVPEERATVADFFDQDYLIEQLRQNDVVKVIYRVDPSNGSRYRKKMRAFYLDSTHEDIVIACRDITDLYKYEQEQRNRLQLALRDAQAASSAKTEFLSRMSHDLRTPMNVIIGLTSLAMDNVEDPAEMKDTLSNITSSAKYLLSLINDCLDIEKIDSGQIELHPTPYSYSEFHDNMQAVIGPLCRQKGLTLFMDEKSDIVPIIIADKVRLEQIYYNLLSNAVKFTPSGGRIELLTQTVEHDDKHVVNDCIIRDNGIGMSSEFQKHMFEPFAQESNDISPEYSGTGLGLPIVKRLVELMGGVMTVKSALNEGTEFRIRFTFPIADKEVVSNGTRPPDPHADLRDKNVLIAEDHPINLMIAVKLLEKAGMHVTSAENGQEAIEKFRSSKEKYFSAVLMDIRMPVINGLEAAKVIRSLDRRDARAVPIIAMTANAFDTDIKASLDAGMNAHLSKPVDSQLLYDTLSDLITRE